MSATTDVEPTWSELIAGIGTWRNRSERAVNKPLLTLIMLARAQRRESNIIPYRDVDDVLTKALRDFGPRRQTYHPEYPFWYLQYDGFWTVYAAVELVQPGQAQPTRNRLLKAQAVAIVPESRWSELQSSPGLIPSLAQQILYTFWPASLHDAIADDLGLDLNPVAQGPSSRQRDPRFRSAVLLAYERRCAICGFQARLGSALVAVEAAHIHSKENGGPDVVPNGLALCSLHHKAFDRGAVGVDQERRVMVSQDLDGNEPGRQALIPYNGRPILDVQVSSDRPGTEFLAWHHKYVFRSPARPYP